MKKYCNIAVALIIFFAVVIICGCVTYKIGTGPVSKDTTNKTIVIEENSTYLSISSLLKESNLIKSELFYKFYVKIFKPTNLQKGTYLLNENMGVKNIIDLLEKGNNTNLEAIKITFKEGKNMRAIARLIEENTNNKYDDVFEVLKDKEYIDSLITKYWFLTDSIESKDIYYPLEGYLFPETYEFLNKDVSIKTIFETMLNQMEKELESYKTTIKNSSLSIHEIITLASIVELEAGNSDDRASVAQVFYNRIKSKWTLGSDVTGYYAYKMDDWTKGLTYSQISGCNAYNTRGTCFIGLPVGPIGNPGMQSINAVLNPKSHNYYYFVADCSGKTYLNYDETSHNATIAKLKKEDKWCDK